MITSHQDNGGRARLLNTTDWNKNLDCSTQQQQQQQQQEAEDPTWPHIM
jgi:hypothetical protein